MKKITLFTVFLLAISIGLLNAQTNKGKVLLGVSSTLSLAGTGSDLMSLGYSTIKQKSNAAGFEESDPLKNTSINLSPKVGYFVIDNLALGLDLDVALSISKDGEDHYKYSQTSMSIDPFIRYYIPTSKVLPFFEISSSFGSLNSKMDYTDPNQEDFENKYSIFSFGGGIGLAAPLSERITFDVLAGYNSLTRKNKKDNDDNVRIVTGTLGLIIGFTIFLGSN